MAAGLARFTGVIRVAGAGIDPALDGDSSRGSRRERRMQQGRRIGLALAFAVAVAAPASAQVVHSVTAGLGAFFPRGFDSRVGGDALVEDLSHFEPLAFRIQDFRGASLFGEWNVAFGDRLEVGAGVGYYARTVPSVYRNLVNIDGREIEQDLGLRVIPATVIVRVLAGRAGFVQPYVGGGLAALNFRYTESGEFVDTTNYDVFPARYIATGTALGGAFVLGVRLPIGGDIYGFTTEWRYLFGAGDTGGFDAGFLPNATKIDLSGGSLNFGFLVRF
jgi:hypothetical protein